MTVDTDTTVTLTVSETLDKAADLIAERGWDHGGGWPYSDDAAPRPLCLEGGIMAAMGFTMDLTPFEDIQACPAYVAVVEHLDGLGERVHRGFHGDLVPELWRWNDRTGRADAEVIQVLRDAAEANREKGN